VRPINENTRELALRFIREAIKTGDMNASLEAFAFATVILSHAIAKQDGLVPEDLALALIASAFERLDEPDLRLVT
jgi:hypothetical protein